MAKRICRASVLALGTLLSSVLPSLGSGPAAAPQVEILTPTEGQIVSYLTKVTWRGNDPGGVIVRYEVAADPPSAFTLAEIESPETAPGLMLTIISGPGVNQDTLRVSKPTGGGPVHFDYVQTPLTEMSFQFRTPHADSVYNPATGHVVPRPTFSGPHTVYVRALDDTGTLSRPDRVSFTALTATPSAQITYPEIVSDLLSVGNSITVRWSGEDIDAPDPQVKPVGYYYKLLNTTDLGLNCITINDPKFLYFFTNVGDSGWNYMDADTPERTFVLPVYKCFLFGVRAVDVAGAVEPFLEFHRNVFKARVVPYAGSPHIILSEPSLGRFDYAYPGLSHEATAPGIPLHFTWSVNAEAYGGAIEALAWGVDVTDLYAEGPGSGWSDWGTATSSPPVEFPGPGLHLFAVRARDTAGTINVAQLRIQVVAVTRDREVLYVDDYPDGVYPRDGEHDAFWLGMFDPAASGGRFQAGDVSSFDVFGPNDVETIPHAPTLGELGRYKLVVWSGSGGGYNATQALLEVTARQRTLAAYLRAGGALWLSGYYTVGGTLLSPSGQTADLNYPKLTLGPGDFVWDYLKLHSGRIDNDKGVTTSNTFSRAIPADSVLQSEPHIYDAMHVAWSKFNPRQARGRGVSFVDAVFSPIYAESEPGFRGDVDSLYLYGAAGPLVFNQASTYHQRLCAVRWHDPDPAPEHGRVQWFGFPMYYFQNAQAQATFNRSIDWFREVEQPIPVRLLAFTAVRDEDGALITWEVADAQGLAGFHVHREATGGERQRLTTRLLTGGSRFEYRDPAPPAGAVAYWLEEMDRAGTTTWHGPALLTDAAPASRLRVVLAPIVPNPFTASARIRFVLDHDQIVHLTVFDLQGRPATTLAEGPQRAGAHEASWDGRLTQGGRAPAGLYFFRLVAGEEVYVRKALLVR